MLTLILYSKLLEKSTQTKVMKNLKFWLQITIGNRYFCIQISENCPTYGDFGFHWVRSPTCPNFKTHKTFVLQGFLLHTYISIPKLFTIILSRDLKNQKVGHHPPSTTKIKK